MTSTAAINKEVDLRTLQEEVITAKSKYIEALATERNAGDFAATLRAELERQVADLTKQWSEKYATPLAVYDEAVAERGACEQELRDLVADYCEEAGTKTFDSNLGIRVSTKFEYDEGAAVDWAVFNAPVMIRRTIDRKAFESLPQTKNLEFVTVVETATTVIKGLKTIGGQE